MSNLEVTMTNVTTTTTTTSNTTSSTSTVNKAFVPTLKSILRIVEMILSLVAFICAAVGRNHLKVYWGEAINLNGIRGGAAWCMFVSMFSLLIFLLTYFLWLFNVFTRAGTFPVRFMEFIIYMIFCGFYLIAGIVAASFARNSSGLGAAAFFNFVLTILCIADGVFHYRDWSSSQEGPYSCCNKGGPSQTTHSTTTGPSYPSTGHPAQAGPETPRY